MAFTFFFRDRETLDAIARLALPELWYAPRIRVWDAGCASGQEPYSLAVVLAEALDPFSFRNVRIDATDYEESGTSLFEDMIREGIYSRLDLEPVPSALVEKYFNPTGRDGTYQATDALRERIVFQRHDLLTMQEIGNDFGLVVCKNVLIHFSPDQQAGVCRMFHRALLRGGFLAFDIDQPLPPEVAPLFERVTGDARLYRKLG